MQDQITKARIAFISSNHYSIMTVSAPLTLKGSESFILSLAEFLEEVVQIPPPNIAEYIIESHHPTTEEYFGPWCDLLFTLLQKKKYMEDNGEILFLSTITYEYYQKNLMNNSFFRSEKLEGENAFQIGEQLRRSFGSKTKSAVSKKTKKIAIINFSASVANLDRLKPKIHLQGLYSGQLYRPGDEWHSYRILNNDIPSEQQISNHNVIILTGSSYSVNNLCPQVCGFTHNLSKSLIANKRLKILATCFGHQLLSWMHGSSIISKNLIKGTQQVNFSTQKKALDLPFLDQIAHDHNRLKLYEYHNDYVVSVPKGFIKVCQSQSCGIQSLVSLDQRIWTFQFHPQYTAQYIKSYEMRQAHYLHKDYAESKISCDQKHHQSMRMMRRAMRKFIDMQDK